MSACLCARNSAGYNPARLTLPMAGMLTPTLIEAIAKGVRSGLHVESVCEALSLSIRTLYYWLEHPATNPLHAELVDAVTRARAEREAELVRRLDTAVDARGNRDWRADAWLLSHGPTRTRWFEHRQTEVISTPFALPELQTVRNLTDAELRSLVDASETPALPMPAPERPRQERRRGRKPGLDRSGVE